MGGDISYISLVNAKWRLQKPTIDATEQIMAAASRRERDSLTQSVLLALSVWQHKTVWTVSFIIRLWKTVKQKVLRAGLLRVSFDWPPEQFCMHLVVPPRINVRFQYRRNRLVDRSLSRSACLSKSECSLWDIDGYHDGLSQSRVPATEQTELSSPVSVYQRDCMRVATGGQYRLNSCFHLAS